jgi:uncharacterized SAM-binding protein YcdF (DUF218 family)
MLYFIQFFYQTFLLPPGIILVLLVLLDIRLFYKKQRNIAWALLGLTILLYGCATPLCSNPLVHLLENRYQPPKQIHGDIIVMLGGGATLDTPNLHSKGHLSGAAANRLLTCIQLYHQLQVPIIISGGQVYKTTGVESEIAKSILLDVGIPNDQIIIENKSLNTTQNATYTHVILDRLKYRQPILVTSAFHMPRAVTQFQKVGVRVIPYPTDYYTNVKQDFTFTKLIPSSEGLSEFSLALKEYIGLMVIKWY